MYTHTYIILEQRVFYFILRQGLTHIVPVADLELTV